jgi:hypothetical protein
MSQDIKDLWPQRVRRPRNDDCETLLKCGDCGNWFRENHLVGHLAHCEPDTAQDNDDWLLLNLEDQGE